MGLLKDSLTVGSMRVLLTGIIFLTDLVVSRFLGVALKGEYFFLVSAVLLVGTLLTAGLHLGNIYYSRTVALTELAANSLIYLLGLAVLTFGLGYPLLGYLPTLSQGSFWLKILFLNCLVLECGFAIFLNFFVAAGRLWHYALIRIANRSLLLFLMVLAWFKWQASLELLLGIHSITLLLALLIMGWIFPRERARGLRQFRPGWQSFQKSLQYGLQGQGMVAVDLGTQRLNILLLGFWATPRDNGLYSVALNFGQALWLLANALIVVVQSRVSKSPEKQLGDLEILSRHSLLLMIGGALALAWSADFIIGAGYGPEFRGAGDLLRAMLPGLAAYSLYSLFSSFLVTNGMAAAAFWCALGGLAVNVGLASLLIPSQGGLGAARAVNWGYLTSTALLLLVLTSSYRVRLRSLLIFDAADFRQLVHTLKNLSSKAQS